MPTKPLVRAVLVALIAGTMLTPIADAGQRRRGNPNSAEVFANKALSLADRSAIQITGQAAKFESRMDKFNVRLDKLVAWASQGKSEDDILDRAFDIEDDLYEAEFDVLDRMERLADRAAAQIQSMGLDSSYAAPIDAALANAEAAIDNLMNAALDNLDAATEQALLVAAQAADDNSNSDDDDDGDDDHGQDNDDGYDDNGHSSN